MAEDPNKKHVNGWFVAECVKKKLGGEVLLRHNAASSPLL